MKKRFLGVFLAMCLCLILLPTAASAETADVWDGSTVTQPAGSGTGMAPYLISTGAELAWLAQMTRSSDYAVYYVKFTGDIVLNEGTFDQDGTLTKNGALSTPNVWTPIGQASWRVDGDGHSVSGMYINNSGENNVGLFSYLYGSGNDGAYIKNLTIKNSYVKTVSPDDYRGYAGVFVGKCYRCTFTDCAGETNILSTSCYGTGGIVGGAQNSSFNAVHTSGSINGKKELGGLVGRTSTDSMFKNCWNETDIKNVSGVVNNVGGIAGYADGTACFYNCANLGKLRGGSRVGGIVGECGVTKMRNCYSLKDIADYVLDYGTNRTGTLTGMGGPTISLCYAEDGSTLKDTGAAGGTVTHFTGKGKLTENGTEDDLLNALNDNLFEMEGEADLKLWVRDANGYPLPKAGRSLTRLCITTSGWAESTSASATREIF